VTLLARTLDRYYSPSYASEGISSDSDLVAKATKLLKGDESISIGQRQSILFQEIINARATAAQTDWDGEGAQPVGDDAVGSAIALLYALPALLPPPQITPEPTGEIAFEWYTSRNKVVVLTVDQEFIRWSAIVGTDAPLSGAEPFTKTIPGAALLAINSVVG